MIDEILPAAVVAVETRGDPVDAPLFPEEEAVIRSAVHKRRQEFATVRFCARSALATLGLPPMPIVPGVRGAPGWPAGVVGSMTHCAGYRAAAVARTEDIVTVGIDAEPHEDLPDGVLGLIALDPERVRLDRLRAEEPHVRWDRLLFSAKEAVFKAWYPLAQRWLDFSEADITVRPEGTFTARLLVPGPVVDGRAVDGFEGRWLARNGLILTAIARLPIMGGSRA